MENIFVYGSLQTDGDNYDIMRTACGEFLYACDTVDPYLVIDIKDGYGTVLYPAAIWGAEKYEDTVTGQLFEVPEAFMEVLDSFESGFTRSEVQVEIENTITTAWMYFLDDMEMAA